ncbi:TonB-dependent receptor [Iodidimonas sp. SYSU 1G8]|uniref:TonB-dependent receptor n=1 Tax=Iodidimonas sp. SYSU 1G8 TaxID=3133967 RepID=UPI0031FED80E
MTARKQVETLQEVPVTVSTVGGADIERFNYDQVSDITTRIPTLSVQTGGSGSGASMSLRGVGSSYISAAFDSAVALDFDGMQVSSMRVLQSAFVDVRQIEVLKGPQSLYFGKSASAGVLSIKSADPTDEWEVGGKVAYEFEERGVTTQAYLSGPLSDKVGIRLVARYNNIHEVYLNSAPVADPHRGERNINVRATLDWEPTDDFDASLKLNYIRHANDGAIQRSAFDCGANGVPDPVFLLSGAVVLPAGYGCDTPGGRKTFYLTDPAPPLSVQAPSEGPDQNGGVPYGRSTIFFGVLKWDWQLSESLSLSSVTGYIDQSAQDLDAYSYGGVVGGVSYGAGTGLTDNQLRQFSQELRLRSDFDHWFNFMVGAFYEDRHIEFNTSQNAVNISFFGPDPVTGNTFDWFKQHPTDTRAISVFGSAAINFTDQLELSGGVRWTHEKKVNHIVVPYVHAFLAGTGAFIQSGFDSGPIEFRDSNISPEVTLSYKATDDLNFYASYKAGFKSGGIDNSALPSSNLLGFASSDPAVREATADALIYGSETARGGEVGVKSQWADRTLTLNLSAFYYVFKNLQVQNFDAVAIQFLTTNAGEVTSKGLDLDWRWETPVQGLSFYGSMTYLDTKYTAPFDPNPLDGIDANLQGRQGLQAPHLAGNATADLRVPLGNAWEFGLTGSAQYSGSYFTSFDNFRQKSFWTFDLAASIGDPDGSWQLAVIGTNLANKRYLNSSGPRPFLQGGVGDDIIRTYSRGRQISIEASFRF